MPDDEETSAGCECVMMKIRLYQSQLVDSASATLSWWGVTAVEDLCST